MKYSDERSKYSFSHDYCDKNMFKVPIEMKIKARMEVKDDLS